MGRPGGGGGFLKVGAGGVGPAKEEMLPQKSTAVTHNLLIAIFMFIKKIFF
jgi:hypothetical protein